MGEGDKFLPTLTLRGLLGMWSDNSPFLENLHQHSGPHQQRYCGVDQPVVVVRELCRVVEVVVSHFEIQRKKFCPNPDTPDHGNREMKERY